MLGKVGRRRWHGARHFKVDQCPSFSGRVGELAGRRVEFYGRVGELAGRPVEFSGSAGERAAMRGKLFGWRGRFPALPGPVIAWNHSSKTYRHGVAHPSARPAG